MSAGFTIETVFDSDGWLEFSREKWGLMPHRLRLTKDGKELPALDAVVYLDKRGRVRMPPLNPFLPVRFTTTPTNLPARLTMQWLTVAGAFVEEFKRRGLEGTVAFLPQLRDVRPWQWSHFDANVRYAHYIPLPFQQDETDGKILPGIVKAYESGFSCRMAERVEDVFVCLRAGGSQTRPYVAAENGGKFALDCDDLGLGRRTVGKESFRCYVVYGPNNEPTAACVVLYAPGGEAVVWIDGAKSAYLNFGTPQLLMSHLLNDMSELGAKGLYLMGESVGCVSANGWNPKVLPYYAISRPGWEGACRHITDVWRFQARR